MLKASVKDSTLFIEIPFDQKGRSSSSGKSTVHANTNGNQPTTVEVDGKVLIIGLNTYTQKC